MHRIYDSRHSWPAWLLLSGTLVAVDQFVKHYFSTTLELGSSRAVTSFFNLVHTRNYGAAFSFLADAGGWQRYFFLIFGVIVTAFLAWLVIRGVADLLETFAYAAIIGGALGNVIDRARLGYVVDYLDFHWKGWHWPAFNVADMCITAGAACLVAASIFQARAGTRGVNSSPGSGPPV